MLEKGVGPKEQKHDQCLKAQLSNRALEVDEGPNKQQYNLDAAQLDEDSEQQERDQDLEAVGANEKVWQRHLDWLKVILSHYGAVRTLVVYVNGPHFRPYKAISMRIMNYPPSSRQLLSWKTLLNPACRKLTGSDVRARAGLKSPGLGRALPGQGLTISQARPIMWAWAGLGRARP